jgi:hypothetical protein
VTTDKRRLTVYLRNAAQLDALREEARRLVPLELRGRISASTCIEAAVLAALAELRANGKESAWLETLVALPRAKAAQDDAADGGEKQPG